MPSPQTKSSTRKLSDVARHVIAPSGIVSTGWPAVEAKCRTLGISFRWWQVPIGRLILAKRADGKYASTIGGTGLSIPRQVGKTFLVAAIVFALCLLRPGLTVIWTAHRLKTAEETFGKLQVFAKRRRIAPYVKKIPLGSGNEAIEFVNGSRILFGARERGFGRGFDEVDVLVFDEAQILGESALDDMVPSANQTRQDTGALMLFMGTPPKPGDKSEVFTRMRNECLTGEDEDTAWAEFGADPGYKPAVAPAPLTKADWAQVAKANISYPDDTPPEAILRMRKKLGPDSFLREGLGIWDVRRAGGLFPAWDSLGVDAPSGRPDGFGIDMTVDRAWTSIGVYKDGYVDVVEHRPSGAWLIGRCLELADFYGVPFVIGQRGPASSEIEPLQKAGVPLTVITGADYVTACGQFYDAATQDPPSIRHGVHPDLDAAVASATKHTVGDGFVWERRGEAVVSPLIAVTLARFGAVSGSEPRVRSL